MQIENPAAISRLTRLTSHIPLSNLLANLLMLFLARFTGLTNLAIIDTEN